MRHNSLSIAIASTLVNVSRSVDQSYFVGTSSLSRRSYSGTQRAARAFEGSIDKARRASSRASFRLRSMATRSSSCQAFLQICE